MHRAKRVMLLVLAVGLAAGAVSAQRYSPERYHNERYDRRRGVPDWERDQQHPHDVFTFVRVRYDSRRGGWRPGGQWDVDYPDSDLNFSYRLQQLTSLQVDPDGKIVDLTDPELFNYPFIYMIEPGRLVFHEAEVEALREYLLNGGFMMVDDFWGDSEWRNFAEQMKRVFPDREPVELSIEHPIFHFIFDLNEKPQVPAIGHAMAGRSRGITWERPGTETPHYRAFFDDEGRIMVIACHNTDLGDGWEREGENQWYFREFSEKLAYPMGINIVMYAMTH